MSFCVNAFSGPCLCSARVIHLQNYLLRQSWLTARFAENIENVVLRESSTILGAGRKSINNYLHIPSRLLKGEWTEERMDLLSRLMRWGALIPTNPSIMDRVPHRLMEQAISQRNALAVIFCMHHLRGDSPRYVEWPGSGSESFARVCSWTTEDPKRKGAHDIIFRSSDLRRWAAKRIKVNDPRGEWLLQALSSPLFAASVEKDTLDSATQAAESVPPLPTT